MKRVAPTTTRLWDQFSSIAWWVEKVDCPGPGGDQEGSKMGMNIKECNRHLTTFVTGKIAVHHWSQ